MPVKTLITRPEVITNIPTTTTPADPTTCAGVPHPLVPRRDHEKWSATKSANCWDVRARPRRIPAQTQLSSPCTSQSPECEPHRHEIFRVKIFLNSKEVRAARHPSTITAVTSQPQRPRPVARRRATTPARSTSQPRNPRRTVAESASDREAHLPIASVACRTMSARAQPTRETEPHGRPEATRRIAPDTKGTRVQRRERSKMGRRMPGRACAMAHVDGCRIGTHQSVLVHQEVGPDPRTRRWRAASRAHTNSSTTAASTMLPELISV